MQTFIDILPCLKAGEDVKVIGVMGQTRQACAR